MRHTIAESLLSDAQPFIDDGSEDRRKSGLNGRPPRELTEGRRGSRRWRVLLSALIVDPAEELVIPCRAENVSDSGARIKLSEVRSLPATFWLIAVTAGLAYQAKVVWRQQERLGVEVGEPVCLKEAVSAVERRLYKIRTAHRR